MVRGFKVQGKSDSASGSEFRIHAWFEVQGSGFRVPDAGFRSECGAQALTVKPR